MHFCIIVIVVLYIVCTSVCLFMLYCILVGMLQHGTMAIRAKMKNQLKCVHDASGSTYSTHSGMAVQG